MIIISQTRIFSYLLVLLAIASFSCDTPFFPQAPSSGLRDSQRREQLVIPGSILFISFHTRYNQATSAWQLYSMNADGSDITQMTSDPNFPINDARWSPDGKKIAIVSNDSGFIMDASNKKRYLLLQPIFFGSAAYYGSILHPVWSPDSKQLAYGRLQLPEFFGIYHIFAINIDGTNERQITHSSDTTERVFDWSRDGSTILGDMIDYSARDSVGREIENTRVAYFDLQGNYLHTWGELGRTFYHPIYSTSGREIAFVSNKCSCTYQALYIMKSNGNADTLLSQNQYYFYEPVAWSSDDRKILCNAGLIYSGGPSYITLLDRYTGQVTDITPFKNDTTYSFAVSWRKEVSERRLHPR